MSESSSNSNEKKETLVEELMKLSELREKGAISEDEFNELKTKMMMQDEPDTRISEIPSNPTTSEVAELLQKKGLADAAEDLGIFAAHLDAIRKKYGIEISSTRDSSLAKSGASHAQRSIPNKEQSFGQPQILGLIGAALAFVGVFCPIISAPILGSLNYFQNGKGDGTIIILLAVVSVALIFMSQMKKLWFTGVGSLVVMAFTFINFQIKMSEMQSSIRRELADNPFRGISELAIQSVQLQWGWAIIILGAVMLIVAAAMSKAE